MFQAQIAGKNTTSNTKGKKTLNTLVQRSSAMYLHFLIDVTRELMTLSLSLQSRTCAIGEVKQKVEDVLQSLERMKTK